MPKFPHIPLNPFAGNPMVRTTIFIPPIDSNLLPHFNQIAHTLQIVKTARNEALENRPKSDDCEPDEAHQRIASRVGEGTNLLHQFGLNQMNMAAAKIRALMPRPLDPKLTLSEAGIEIARAKAALRDEIDVAFEEESLARRRLNKFRRDHGLARKALYADMALVPLSNMFMLVTGETLFNAMLFKNANPLGLTGGFLQAGMFGLINVGLGFVLGAVPLRLMGHVRLRARLLGGAMAGVLLPAGLLWNAAVAEYRQALEANVEAGFVDPQRWSASGEWQHVISAQSGALLMLGLLIYILSVLKGLGGHRGFWDAYVGYKPVDLDHRLAATHVSDLKAHLRAAIHGALIKVRDGLRSGIRRDEEALNTIQEIAAQAEERAREVEDSLNEWTRMGAALVTKYRQENMAVRSDRPPAAWLTTTPETLMVGNPPSAKDVRELTDEAKGIHAANINAVAEAEQKIAELMESEGQIALGEITGAEDRGDRAADAKWHQESGDTSAPPEAGSEDAMRMAAE